MLDNNYFKILLSAKSIPKLKFTKGKATKFRDFPNFLPAKLSAHKVCTFGMFHSTI